MKRQWILPLFLVLIIFSTKAVAMPFTTDFETGDIRGWHATGNAFRYQPTKEDNVKIRRHGDRSNHQGNYWIGTYEHYQGKPGEKPGSIQGDGPRGRLLSNAFKITTERMSFLVGGGADYATRVELLVETDPIEQRYTPVMQVSGKNAEKMSRVKWDISKYRGKLAKIRIVDDASGRWGHINIDDFKFYNKTDIQPIISFNPIPSYHIEELAQPDQIEKTVVPNVLHKILQDAEAMLDAAGLERGNISDVESDQMEGSIIQQRPVQGTEIKRGSPVDLWIAKKPALRIWIEPKKNIVIIGQNAIFYARSNREDIRFEWKGPNQLARFGRKFVLQTDMLQPGTYNIELAGTDGHERRIASSTLVLKSQPLVEVPNVVGKTTKAAQKALGYVNLLIGNIETKYSNLKPNMILSQNPKAGSHIAQKSYVHLVVSKGYSPLEVRIEPWDIEIEQGDKVSFTFRTNRKDTSNLRIKWKGPDGSTGETPRFTVDTTSLEPGDHFVTLHLYEKWNYQTAEAKLRVRKKAVPAPVQYRVKLRSDLNVVKEGEKVKFITEITPSDDKVLLNYSFGDGTPSTGWIHDRAIWHRYIQAGDYMVTVDASVVGSKPVGSDNLRIGVQRRVVPHDNGQYDLLLMILAGGTLLGLGVYGTGRVFRNKANAKQKSTTKHADVEFRLKEGPISTNVENEDKNIIKKEWSIRVVKDEGEQDLIIGDNINNSNGESNEREA